MDGHFKMSTTDLEELLRSAMGAYLCLTTEDGRKKCVEDMKWAQAELKKRRLSIVPKTSRTLRARSKVVYDLDLYHPKSTKQDIKKITKEFEAEDGLDEESQETNNGPFELTVKAEADTPQVKEQCQRTSTSEVEYADEEKTMTLKDEEALEAEEYGDSDIDAIDDSGAEPWDGLPKKGGIRQRIKSASEARAVQEDWDEEPEEEDEEPESEEEFESDFSSVEKEDSGDDEYYE
ncbi:hypothetical protein PVAG01_04177 [Phlyctema vagabunda]|uniref:Uncharacterized protein n=1 Tax=Phlyctema vagabunda TaxID=108571 RepID=A0ABR4PPS0_9HELO